MGNFSNPYSKHILIRGKIMETWFDVKIVKLSFFRLNASLNFYFPYYSTILKAIACMINRISMEETQKKSYVL